MGSINENTTSQSSKNPQNFIENLTPYDQAITDQFGPIKILKQTEKPYKYIMLYTQNGIDDTLTYKKMQQKLRWYQTLRSHSYVVDIEMIRLLRKTQMCIKKISLQIYTRYFNHTLEMAIEKKLVRNRRFKEADIIYVFKGLLDIWRHISEELHNKYVQLFDIRNIYLTPEGYIRVYPFPIDIQFQSSPLKPKRSSFATGSMLKNSELQLEMSPKKTSYEEREVSSPQKVVRKLDAKDNLKDIGIILLRLLCLNKQADEVESYGSERHAQLIEQFYLNGQISQKFRQIIFVLLLRYKETSFQELSNMYEVYKGDFDRQITTNIKLEDGPQFFQNKQVQKSHNLKRLSEHKNLKVGMISILSKQRSKKEQQ